MSETVRVRRIIDADTIELDREDPTGTYPFERVRLVRVTAPELDSRNPRVREVAFAGVAFLETLVLGRDVELQGEARDKFKRRLASVTVFLPSSNPAMPAGEPHDVESLLVAYGLARWWDDVMRERRARESRRETRTQRPSVAPARK